MSACCELYPTSAEGFALKQCTSFPGRFWTRGQEHSAAATGHVFAQLTTSPLRHFLPLASLLFNL